MFTEERSDPTDSEDNTVGYLRSNFGRRIPNKFGSGHRVPPGTTCFPFSPGSSQVFLPERLDGSGYTQGESTLTKRW